VSRGGVRPEDGKREESEEDRRHERNEDVEERRALEVDVVPAAHSVPCRQ
jgi:hypothetical protein